MTHNVGGMENKPDFNFALPLLGIADQSRPNKLTYIIVLNRLLMIWRFEEGKPGRRFVGIDLHI